MKDKGKKAGASKEATKGTRAVEKLTSRERRAAAKLLQKLKSKAAEAKKDKAGEILSGRQREAAAKLLQKLKMKEEAAKKGPEKPGPAPKKGTAEKSQRAAAKMSPKPKGRAEAKSGKSESAKKPKEEPLSKKRKVEVCSVCGGFSPFAPMSCDTCTADLSKRRRLRFGCGELVWCRGFGPKWPARVAAVGFDGPE
ncbi:unnamed protein product, partial [Effrenium voratum]